MQHKSAVTCAWDTAGLLDTLVLELIAEQRVPVPAEGKRCGSSSGKRFTNDLKKTALSPWLLCLLQSCWLKEVPIRERAGLHPGCFVMVTGCC